MPDHKLSKISGVLLRIAKASGFAHRLQRWPLLYAPMRRVLTWMNGKEDAVRRIVAGPLKGYDMVLGPADRNAYLVNEHEQRIVNLVSSLCRPGMQVLDVGAHVGYFTLLMSVQVGTGGRVVTVEPNPTNVRKIRAMIAANQIANAVLFPVAASNVGGEVEFLVEDTGQMGHIVKQPGANHEARVRVQAERIDEIVSRHHLGKIDLVKMDVEGAEREALTGMREVLLSQQPVVICEWHPSVAGRGYREFFGSLGYRCELLDSESAAEPFHVLARPHDA